jgi:NAD(P)-dependent dehydrogenase (short-subunit alcohol dehydrogenase family)
MAKEKGAVVVTGASSGIGRATALHLDEKGYRVFAGVRKQKDANALKRDGSDRLTPITIDVTKPRSIEAARQKVQRAVGKSGIAGLVNNAGIANAGPVEHIPVDAFREVVEVNLTGQVATTQAFLPLLRRAKRGTVVFVTSIGGRIAYPFMSPYHAAKFGLEGVADSLRREVKPWGIRVVVVEPGSIATDIWDRGVDNFQRISGDMPREANRLYGKQMTAMQKALVETGRNGIEPEKVARVIERAIRSVRPRTRYLVGMDAKVARNMDRLLSDRTFDRITRRVLKLPDEAPPGR